MSSLLVWGYFALFIVIVPIISVTAPGWVWLTFRFHRTAGRWFLRAPEHNTLLLALGFALARFLSVALSYGAAVLIHKYTGSDMTVLSAVAALPELILLGVVESSFSTGHPYFNLCLVAALEFSLLFVFWFFLLTKMRNTPPDAKAVTL